MIPINWRRGLFRMWIAASLVWLIGAGALMQKEIRRDVSALMTAEIQAPKDTSENPAFKGRAHRELERRAAEQGQTLEKFLNESAARRAAEQAQNLTFAASVILLPPILLFALGWAGLWIVRGFRS